MRTFFVAHPRKEKVFELFLANLHSHAKAAGVAGRVPDQEGPDGTGHNIFRTLADLDTLHPGTEPCCLWWATMDRHARTHAAVARGVSSTARETHYEPRICMRWPRARVTSHWPHGRRTPRQQPCSATVHQPREKNRCRWLMLPGGAEQHDHVLQVYWPFRSPSRLGSCPEQSLG